MQPQIDYTKVEAIPYKKTVAFVNHFVISTTQFLNRFSYICEQRLNEVSQHLQKLEISMAILEAKLNSIPEIESSTTATTSAPTQADTSSADVPPPLPPREDEEYQDHTAIPPPVSSGLTVKDDPRYSSYFTMLRLRVPVAAIKQKMMLEGVNPDILDNPDAPSDFTGEVPARATENGYMSGSESEEEGEGW
jgi:WASH complex subunit CCDC53